MKTRTRKVLERRQRDAATLALALKDLVSNDEGTGLQQFGADTSAADACSLTEWYMEVEALENACNRFAGLNVNVISGGVVQ